jgi:hypothetical protein
MSVDLSSLLKFPGTHANNLPRQNSGIDPKNQGLNSNFIGSMLNGFSDEQMMRRKFARWVGICRIASE